jgi:hypothetical protein
MIVAALLILFMIGVALTGLAILVAALVAHVKSGSPQPATPVDRPGPLYIWSDLDELQLTRLLKDHAP